MHIGQLQAFILSMCLVTAGIFGLTGCSDASTNVNNTIYLETTKQTAGSDDTATLPADNESESGNPSDSTGEPENAGTSSDSTTAEASTEVTATVAPVSVNLIAVGDMLLHGGIHNSSLQPDGSYNYAHVFEHTKDRIAAADIAVANQEVILGGVEISYDKGLLGHSDADVLVHAIMDALLGAAALGDIGRHFPDTDPEYKGASSLKLLEHVGKLVEDKLYVIGNIDATIIAQRPKMAPHIETMRENVANVLHIDIDQVNIKATTEEGLGFTGSGEGISAQAIASLDTIANYSYAVGPEEGRCAGCGGCPHAR